MEIRTIFDACRFSPEKMQKVNLFSTNEIFLDVYCLEPGQEQRAHAHVASTKVYVVLEGHARIHVGDESKQVGPGQAVLAPAGERHGVENSSDERLVLLVAMAPPPEHT
ncbi:MAG TPA: cupin domain-containing protein [Vicinamibacteria bacterium]|nr:cupin domain-containing protein [Vicinamibacteria bacterium]